jgi:uncharacterized protein YkwD
LNIADIILAIVVIFFTWLGYKNGFINNFFGLLQWIGAFSVAILFYLPVNGLLTRYFLIEEEWQRPLSFAIAFAAGFLLLLLLFGLLKKVIGHEERYSYINKFTGLLPGFLTGLLIAIVMAKILAASVWFATPEKENKSYLLSSMVNSCDWLDKKMYTVFNAAGEQKVSGANELAYTDSALFKSSNFLPLPILEQQLLDKVNIERSKRGLNPLIADSRLQQAAYNHAADMFTRGYFAHNTPEGINPFERMKKLGINYRNAGENLAHSYNLDSAHNGLMNSPGHRDNILNIHFGKVGIAVLGSDTKGLMVVQEFSN